MKNNKLKIIIFAVLMAIALTLSSGCVTLGERNPIATISFSNGKDLRIRLYPDKAPNTVNNFIQLAESGFYNNSPVHRIDEYFVIQMGKAADGAQNAGYYIKGEFPNNNFSKNDMEFDAGTVAMARSVGTAGDERSLYNTASSQFFITTTNQPKLNGDYAAFGKIISGFEHVKTIAQMDVNAANEPRDDIYIVSVTVETYGKTYGSPSTIPID